MVKINSLEFENVKKIKAVMIEPTKSGLTIIGGRNRQGKTSVLDAIAWTLGGDKFKPSSPHRENSVVDPHLKIMLDNGIVVERSGKNSSLKVIDSTGNKGGQQLLNSFVEQFALDLPKFMNQSGKEKAGTLLKIIGVGDKLYKLESDEQTLYNQRRAIGQIADQKTKFAKEMTIYPGVPLEPVSASDLIRQQQEILARNGENQRKRQQRDIYEHELSEARTAFEKAKARLEEAERNAAVARMSAENLTDESTAELEKNIADIEELNKKIRANLDREKAEIDAENYNNQYKELTEQIENIRNEKTNLLNNADLPLPGLSVENGELIYNGYKWDSMSGADQLIVATSIVRKLNPECGFVLLDKLEQMDYETLDEFGNWLEKEGLQAIATRVSTGDECSIIIEDGTSAVHTEAVPKATWKAGVF